MFTESDIRDLTNAQSYTRGVGYYSSGMVRSLVRRGDVVQAEVSGSAPWPYQVIIELEGDELVSATCSCPYDWGDYCKHIVAVLLAIVRGAGGIEQIEERPSVDEMLAGLDADVLRGLLRDLLVRQPDLTSWLEAKIALRLRSGAQPASAKEGSAVPPPKPAVDVRTIRRLVRDALNNVSGEYGVAAEVVAGLDKVLDLARQALELSDGESALAIVEVVAETVMDEWQNYDDSDGYFGSLFRTVGEVLAEALLTADLVSSERETWKTQLEDWQAKLEDYGFEDPFGSAVLAAQQGWDDPVLQQKLAGDYVLVVHDGLDDGDGGEDEADGEGDAGWDDDVQEWYADAVLAIRFRVLERRGRIDEYLNLAKAEGEIVPYTVMLVKLGRIDEAVEYGLHNLISPEEALPLALALHRQGDPGAALRIGEHGLGLACGQPGDLARWVRDAASAQSEGVLALRAARIAFEADAALADYKAVAALAGAEWSALKPVLLAHLAAHPRAYERIDIYLSEGMVDEAIRDLDARSFFGRDDLEKVAKAAVHSRPDWVIRTCRKQAEPIMYAAQSSHYWVALHWLGLVRSAYLAAGRPNEWRAYCEGLLAQHARKYRLTPGLKELLAT